MMQAQRHVDRRIAENAKGDGIDLLVRDGFLWTVALWQTAVLHFGVADSRQMGSTMSLAQQYEKNDQSAQTRLRL